RREHCLPVMGFPLRLLLPHPALGLDIVVLPLLKRPSTTDLYTLSLHDALPICFPFVLALGAEGGAEDHRVHEIAKGAEHRSAARGWNGRRRHGRHARCSRSACSISGDVSTGCTPHRYSHVCCVCSAHSPILARY